MGVENEFLPQLGKPCAAHFSPSGCIPALSRNPDVDDVTPFLECKKWEMKLSSIFSDAARSSACLLCKLFSFVSQINVDDFTNEAEVQAFSIALETAVAAYIKSSSEALRSMQDMCFWIVKQKLVPPNATCTHGNDETAKESETFAFTEKSQLAPAYPLNQNILSKAAANTTLKSRIIIDAYNDLDGMWWDEAYFADELQKTIKDTTKQLYEENQLEESRREVEKQYEQRKALKVPENSLILSVDTFVWDRISSQSCIVAMPTSRKVDGDVISFSLICQEVVDSPQRGKHVLSVEDEAIGITAKQIVLSFLENFSITENNFRHRTVEEQKTMISNIHRVAEYFLAKNNRNSEILELNADQEVLCGDVRGCFSSLHMTFMRTIPCGEWYSPSVSMLCLGGYSGECEHSVEIVSLLLALQLLYPQRIYIMHSRLDEEEASGDLSNPCSLRVCCRKICCEDGAGDALWHSLTAAVCATPVAAVVRQNFFAAHMEPGSCREATPNDPETSSGDLRSLLDSYCKRPEDVLSHPSIAAVIVAGPLPESCKEANEELFHDQILYFSGSLSSYKGWNGPPNTAQACFLSSSKISVFRWYQHRVLCDGTGFTPRLS